MAHPVSLLITDLDNTLFDWVAVWHASFSTLLHGISAISEVPIEVLIPEIQQIHQFHGTSEYAFLIEEIPSLRTKYGTVDLLEVFAAPIEAFREARRSALKLYPGVMQTALEFATQDVSSSVTRSRWPSIRITACDVWIWT